MDNPYAPPPRDREGRPPEPRPEHRGPAPQQPPPPPPAPRPPAPPPSPEVVATASARLKALALVFLATLLAAGLPWPARLVVALLAIATMVLGVRALAAVRRARLRGPVLAVTVGATLVAGLMAIDVLAALALWPLPLQAQQCSRDALTISAKNLCDAQFQQGVTERLNQLLPGSVSPTP